jgi:ketosteroid isomerase-like protein
MSRENVEIVREGWRAFIERGVDGVIEYYAEDCVIEAVPEAPDQTIREGWEGMRVRYRNFSEAWESLDWEPIEFMEAGEDVVVAVVEMRGRGQVGGALIETPLTFVYELRNGRIVRDRPFTSRSQALEAAGLEE